MAPTRLLSLAAAVAVLSLASAQPSAYLFTPNVSYCPFTAPSPGTITSSSSNRFTLQWCRLAEGGSNTAVSTASGSTTQTYGTRFWGNYYKGPDGGGGPYSLRGLPFSTGGTCFAANTTGISASSSKQCACTGTYYNATQSPADSCVGGTGVDSGSNPAAFPSSGCGVDGPTSYDGSFVASPVCTSNNYGPGVNPSTCQVCYSLCY
jgi:hypothetical protein